MTFDEKPEWSKGAMNRIGEALEGKRDLDKELFQKISHWHEDLLAELYLVVMPILEKRVNHDAIFLRVGQIGNDIVYSSRIKNEDTIVEKLSRLKTDLARIQDFAGGRFDIDCSPSTQVMVANDIAAVFKEMGCKVNIRNYLVEGQHGYRGVHLHITGQAGRVELQIRNKFQAKWANTFELTADLAGRGIRYGERHKRGAIRNLVDALIDLSKSAYKAEIAEEAFEAKVQNFETSLDKMEVVLPAYRKKLLMLQQHQFDLKEKSLQTKEMMIESLTKIQADLYSLGKVE